MFIYLIVFIIVLRNGIKQGFSAFRSIVWDDNSNPLPCV